MSRRSSRFSAFRFCQSICLPSSRNTDLNRSTESLISSFPSMSALKRSSSNFAAGSKSLFASFASSCRYIFGKTNRAMALQKRQQKPTMALENSKNSQTTNNPHSPLPLNARKFAAPLHLSGLAALLAALCTCREGLHASAPSGSAKASACHLLAIQTSTAQRNLSFPASRKWESQGLFSRGCPPPPIQAQKPETSMHRTQSCSLGVSAMGHRLFSGLVATLSTCQTYLAQVERATTCTGHKSLVLLNQRSANKLYPNLIVDSSATNPPKKHTTVPILESCKHPSHDVLKLSSTIQPDT